MEMDDCFYKGIYQLLSRCCTKHNPYDFCGQIVTELSFFIPYAQARILFLDVSGKICGSLLYGVSKRSWENFMDYYKQDLVESKYSLKEPVTLSEREKISVCCHKTGSISVSTVYKHIANIYKKCNISNRQQLYQMFQKDKEGI